MHAFRWFSLVVAASAALSASDGHPQTPDPFRAAHARLAGPVPVLEVLEEGSEDWTPVRAAPAEEGASPYQCSITVRWQSSVATLMPDLAKVRVRGLPWVGLGEAWGGIRVGTEPIMVVYRYSDDPYNSLFWFQTELNQDCDRRRRYRFLLIGREAANGNRRWAGIQREFYFPSSTEWTTDTNLDLGYLDLCIADGHQCDGPYFPGGNPTPYPSGPGYPEELYTRVRQGLESEEEPARGAGKAAVDGGLNGDWLRTDSNNDPNDQMRVRIEENTAILTSVPPTVYGAFQVGNVLWQSIRSDGSLEVRGSDGAYYPAKLAFDGPDLIRIDIDPAVPGNNQTWRRAGPSIDGDWELIYPAGTPEEGTRVRAQGGRGTVRYLPASAPRSLRVGSRLWQGLDAGGAMEVLGADGRYRWARAELVGADSLRVERPEAAPELWVRPGIAQAARATLAAPPATGPGSDLRQPEGLPGITPGPGTPPTPEAECLATSLPLDGTELTWGWGITSPTDDDPQEETLGIREYLIPDLPAGSGIVPSDLERSRIPGFDEGFGILWQRMSRRVTSQEHRDLTAAEYELRSRAARDAGLRAVDIEAYPTSDGTRYAGIWVENAEGAAWQAEYDLTDEAYGQAFASRREEGFRLVDMEAYETPGGLRYAAIWYRSCDNTNWRQVRGMSLEAYRQRADSLGALGFRVVDIESYSTPGGQRYAAIWQQTLAGRSWEARVDRTLQWFLNDHREHVDAGFRLVDYESYETSEGIRYAGVWAENDARYDLPFRVALDDSIQAYRARHGIPGISVVVMQGDEVVYRRGFGWADSTQQKMAHAGTAYLAASVSKVIGATLAARLEQQGVLDLSRPTRDYLDSLPSHHTHTVEQLLAKIGCTPHYPEGNEPDTGITYAWREPALEQIWDDPLLANCTPAQQYHYSTHGFTYVGAVLEAVAEKPIADILYEQITFPWGLHSMGVLSPEEDQGWAGLGVRPYDLAQGYQLNRTAGTGQARAYENTTWKVLGGGIRTDALDLARFGHLTRTNALADTTRLWTPLTDGTTVNWATQSTAGVPTVGLAWVLGTANGERRMAQHGGTSMAGFGGARAHLRVYRDDGLVIAILTNQQETLISTGGHPIPTLSNTIAGAIFNPPLP